MNDVIQFLTRKIPKPRGFNYIPIYFNPEKHELQERVRKLKEQMQREEDIKNGIEPKPYERIDYRGKFSSQIGKKRNLQKASLLQSLRLIVILGLLMFGAYKFFYSDILTNGITDFLTLLKNKNG